MSKYEEERLEKLKTLRGALERGASKDEITDILVDISKNHSDFHGVTKIEMRAIKKLNEEEELTF